MTKIEKMSYLDPRMILNYSREHNAKNHTYVVIENFLDEETLNKVDEAIEREASANNILPCSYANMVGSTFNSTTKLEFDPVFKPVDDLITQKLLAVNDRTFKVELSGLNYATCLEYNEDDDLNWHTDGPWLSLGKEDIPDSVQYRKLSATILLSKKEDFLGGDFEIVCLQESPGRGIHRVSLDRGSMIMFPAFTMHRVTKIFDGRRRAMIYRFSGPRWK